ncbi:MAG: GIY-YIG nuclease family protein [Candidatus Woesearchaeota archaeon]|jgi:hypothetical protein
MITYENSKESAILSKTINELKEKYPSHYKTIYRNGWHELINHLKTKKPNGYWNNKQNCINAALTCTNRTEFSEKYSRAKSILLKNGTYNEVMSYIPTKGIPKNYWTKEKCKEISLKYKDLHLFRKEQEYPYSIIIKNKWEDEMLSHMFRKTETITRVGSYTFEDCKNVAELCTTKLEFQNKYPSHYQRALKKKWIDILSQHMTPLQKPSGYWTKERCHEEALKYKTRVDFQKNSGSARNAARNNGWEDEICSHMEYVLTYWTKEMIQQEALKYQRKVDFQKKSPSAYNSCLKNKWIDEICSHMDVLYINWTKEMCLNEAIKYTTRKDFVKYSPRAYNSAYNNGFLDEICSHMEYIFKPNGYWTYDKCLELTKQYTTLNQFTKDHSPVLNTIRKNGWNELVSHLTVAKLPNGYWTYEKCKKEALKYKSRSEMKGSTAYHIILSNKWDELLSHMIPLTSLAKRFIYAFEFEDNHVYVGLTYNIKKRYSDHLCEDKTKRHQPVKKHHIATGSNFLFKTLIDNAVPIKEAQKLEHQFIEDYRQKGWIVLNKAKAGGLGGMREIYTEKYCKEQLSKITKFSELSKVLPTHAISKLKEKNIFNDLTSHLIPDVHYSGHWNNKENCRLEALKYKTKTDFQKYKHRAFEASVKNGWIDEICSHMEKKVILKDFYSNIENCRVEAMKYKCKKDFNKKSHMAYVYSNQNGWIDEICSHMIDSRKVYPKINFNTCKEEALKYNYKEEFRKNSRTAFYYAYYNGWLTEITSHMPSHKVNKSIWTKDKCEQEALKYKSRWKFKLGNKTAYENSRINKWLDEFFPSNKIA